MKRGYDMNNQVLAAAVILALAASSPASAENEDVNTDGDLTACMQSVKRPGIESLVTEECQAAGEYYREAIEKSPDEAENYLMMGRCHGLMGQFEAALQYADRYIELRPDDWTGHMDKAMDYVALKQNQDAAPELRKALELLKSQNGKSSDIEMVEDMIKRYGQ